MIGLSSSRPPANTWVEYAIFSSVSLVLVLINGLLSGMLLSLMSQEDLTLEILQKTGTKQERKHASRIAPLLKNQHFTLVTLILVETIASEALPIFLDKMMPEYAAIGVSVSLVLVFGEIIPEALAMRYGLQFGGYTAWFARLLQILVFPVAYPIAKILDCLLGQHHTTLFRKPQLKELIRIHATDASILSHDELKVIKSTMEFNEKKVSQILTPLDQVFMLDYNSTLDFETIQRIVAEGYSRVPVFKGDRSSIVGVFLVKSLIIQDPKANLSISSLELNAIPMFPSDMNLWSVLSQLQLGRSKLGLIVDVPSVTEEAHSKSTSITVDSQSSSTTITATSHKIIGIVTLEDVLEELLQSDIVDETDEHSDVTYKTQWLVRLMNNMHTTRKTVPPSRHRRSKTTPSITIPTHQQDSVSIDISPAASSSDMTSQTSNTAPTEHTPLLAPKKRKQHETKFAKK